MLTEIKQPSDATNHQKLQGYKKNFKADKEYKEVNQFNL